MTAITKDLGGRRVCTLNRLATDHFNMQLKQLNRVFISMAPWTGTARSAREFLARCTAPKAVASNPDCKVETELRLKGESYVEIEYANKQIDNFKTANMTVQQIIARIRTTSETMDTREQLKAAGLADVKLESNWGVEVGRERECGKPYNSPDTGEE